MAGIDRMLKALEKEKAVITVVTEILLLIAIIIFLLSFIYPELMEKKPGQGAPKA